MGVRGFVIAALLVLPLAGCDSTESTIVCADYHDYASAAEAGQGTSLVVVGRVVGDAGERTIYGEQVPVHLFDVETVVKGELPDDARQIEVAAAPLSCNGPPGPFPDGDPLDTDERVEIFLFEENGEHRLITPWDRVAAAPHGEPLPWAG